MLVYPFIHVFMKVTTKFWKRCNPFVWLAGLYWYNGIYRLLLEMYLEMAIYGFLNIWNVSYDFNSLSTNIPIGLK